MASLADNLWELNLRPHSKNHEPLLRTEQRFGGEGAGQKSEIETPTHIHPSSPTKKSTMEMEEFKKRGRNGGSEMIQACAVATLPTETRGLCPACVQEGQGVCPQSASPCTSAPLMVGVVSPAPSPHICLCIHSSARLLGPGAMMPRAAIVEFGLSQREQVALRTTDCRHQTQGVLCDPVHHFATALTQLWTGHPRIILGTL